MSHRSRIPLMLLLGIVLVTMFLANSAEAATPLARISGYKGDVFVLSGTDFTKVTQVGQALKQGDTVQTKEGEAEITFEDGAVMKVRRHTSTMLQEQEEKSGWWLFKTSEWVRRVTVQVGTLWFKSGSSKTKNYLQTPTAVCGLRGSIADFGFDNVMAYVNMVEGSSETKGLIQSVTRDFFNTLQAKAQQNAAANDVYTKLDTAYNKDLKAKDTGTALDQADARVATLAATAAAIVEILKNPDLTDDAKRILNQALTNVKKDLTDAEGNLDKVKQGTSTTTGDTSTTVGDTSTTVGDTSTTISESTTSVAESTVTTTPPTTVSITIPSTTTTTSQKASP